MFKNYFIVAFRSLKRQKVFSVINIAGLGIALTSCLLILLYTKDEASFDRFHANAHRICRLTQTWNMGSRGINYVGTTGLLAGPGFAQAIPEITALVRLKEGTALVKKGSETLDEHFFYADSTFFKVFSFPLVAGNPQAALSGVESVVITEETALKYFGTEEAVGKTLAINTDGKGFTFFQVTAVAKTPPQNSSIRFTMLLSFSRYQHPFAVGEGDWTNAYLHTFLLLHPAADDKAVEAKLPSVFRNNAAETIGNLARDADMKISYGLQPLTELHLAPLFKADGGLTSSSKTTYSYILSCIAGFLLLIASVNFINLSVAQSLGRAKEVGVRKVVGSLRGQLVKQFLSESFLLCLLAFILAVVLVNLALPVFNELAGKQLSFSYLLDRRLMVGFLGLFLFTVLLAGSYPAWVLSGFKPLEALSGEQRLTGRQWFGRFLVVIQFSLATFLVIGTVVIYRQMHYLTNQPLGYDQRNLIHINLPREGDQLLPLLKNELVRQASIVRVTGSTAGPMKMRVEVSGTDLQTSFVKIHEHYLTTFRIPLLKGRALPAAATGNSKSVLVNETFVKQVGWKDPVGQLINDPGDPAHPLIVAGVVKDYHFRSLKEKIEPLILGQFPFPAYNEAWVRINPANLPRTLALLEQAYRKVEPLFPFRYQFQDQLIAQQYEAERRWQQIIGYAAVLTILISCVGLLALAALSIHQRTKEIGIRKILGASLPGIVGLLSKDFVRLIALAFLPAIPLGYYAANQWLNGFAYRTSLSWWLFALAGVLVLTVALLTVGFQSVKAALANPVKSLRNE